jgi:hypothetical protein
VVWGEKLTAARAVDAHASAASRAAKSGIRRMTSRR